MIKKENLSRHFSCRICLSAIKHRLPRQCSNQHPCKEITGPEIMCINHSESWQTWLLLHLSNCTTMSRKQFFLQSSIASGSYNLSALYYSMILKFGRREYDTFSKIIREDSPLGPVQPQVIGLIMTPEMSFIIWSRTYIHPESDRLLQWYFCHYCTSRHVYPNSFICVV